MTYEKQVSIAELKREWRAFVDSDQARALSLKATSRVEILIARYDQEIKQLRKKIKRMKELPWN
jgi:GTP1/Obg family GTP-binding protein